MTWMQLSWFNVSKGDSAVQEKEPWGASSHASLDRSSEDGFLEKDRRTELPSRRPSLWHDPRFLLSHIVTLIAYALLLFWVTKGKSCGIGRNELLDSPAVEAIEWELRPLRLEDRIQEEGGFVGKPSPKLDKAWHDLLNAENIVIEPEYVKGLGREDISVTVPGGTGFIGTLNVYHELHCLKRIHQYMYSEHYFPHLNEHDREMNRLHNEHCIDYLRQSAMCHGDVGLITFEWHNNSRIPVSNSTSHQCVNWEKLDSWTKARTVNMMKPGWLVHPTKGLAYPDGKGDKIGALDESMVAHME